MAKYANRYGLSAFAPFSASAENPITGTMSNVTLGSSFRIHITGHFFLCATGTYDGVTYQNLAVVMATQCAASGGVGFNALFNNYSRGWTLYNDSFHTLHFNVPTGSLLTQRVFGYNPGNNTSLVSVSSSWYHWQSFHRDRAKWTRPYEPESRFFDHETDDGNCVSFGRMGSAKYSDWSHEFEPKANVWNAFANPEDSYTMERFFADVGADKPFLVMTGGIAYQVADYTSKVDGVYRLRADGANFKPRFHNPSWHERIHIDIKSRVLSGGFKS
jgi:hypothetical protein